MTIIPEAITIDLRNGMGLDECLKKHNTNLKTLLQSNYPSTPVKSEQRKYIEKKGDTFYIKKKFQSKTYYFGRYYSLEDAQKVRDKLIFIGWKQNQVDNICKKLGVNRIPSKNEHRYFEGSS
ncbi:hypothetical protein [uncultured Methanobrevibacter sp.]|uniref:hypothetical protein n=1 Tax=uncultured Methanobrevibacter sp. TaxID=253161 RepID=UPI0025F61AD5|nr:hypothetical protein [uncultured Methanobrevibacter sp.]